MTPTPKTDPIVPVPPDTKLTYEQSNMLSQDYNFRGRIKIACLTYANYISNESPGAVAHNTRYKWAQNTMLKPDMVGAQMQPPVVMQKALQKQGSAISDKALQTAVEVTVNQLI